MKKFIGVIAAALVLISTSSYAGVKYGENPALVTFENTFKGALDVKWSEAKDVISASFVLGETHVVAYFSTAGELLGTARNILFNQLPLVVMTEINKKYGSVNVYDIIEYTTSNGTFYTMTADMPTKTLKIKSSSLGELSVEKKTKK